MAVELEQEAEKAVGEVLQAWAAPCVDVVMGLVAKARAGFSDADFRAEVEVVLSGLAEMALTDDEVLVEALWDAGAQAYRAGWVANGDDVAGSKRNCHKPPGEPCREHPKGNGVRMLSDKEAWRALGRRKNVKDKQKRKVVFGNRLQEHIYKDAKKERMIRAKDLLFAHDTVMNGQPGIDPRNGRRIYLKDFLGINTGDPFTMKVVCVPSENGKYQEVLTFFRMKKR